MSLWNHEQIDCLFKSLFGKILIKTIRSASLALCGVTGGSPSQRISNKVSVFVPLCHYNHEWHRYNHLGVFLLIKGLITVGRELRQHHPSDLLSGAGTPRERSSRGCCCRNSRPTVINPDYNMTKQRYITHIYDKIRSNSPPNRATSSTCLHYDVTHLSLTTRIVALHIPSWRDGVREEHRQASKTVWPVNAGRVICRYQNNLCGITNHHKHVRVFSDS